MPRLVDTTIRLLSQEPLAGRMPTSELLQLAEVLDRAGFACLEVSGGGVFDAAVRGGMESPWERIRALKSRTKTPLGLALRGRFLVGSRPVGADFIRRFVSSAAENGIGVFRLHDPLNDVMNLREAAEAIVKGGGEFHAGLVYSPGRTGESEGLIEQARKLSSLGATRVLIHDPTGSLEPYRAHELVAGVADASGLPVGLYCQGAAGNGLAAALEAVRAGADLIACAVYPVALSLYRVSGEALATALEGMGQSPGVNVDSLWEASDLVDEFIGDEPVTPLAPRIAVRAAEHNLPAGLVASLDARLRQHAAGDRLLDVLEELTRIRAEAGWPPLAAPIGQILASQALIHVLSARRYGTVVDEFRSLVQGRYGRPPAESDPDVVRAVALLSDGNDFDDDPPTAEDVRAEAEGLAASEEELVLIALFGEEAEALLQTIRVRGSREDRLAGGVDQSRAERIRELVRIVQESGVAEIEIEDEGMRVSVRRTEERAQPLPTDDAPFAEPDPSALPALPTLGAAVRVESPMVGTFYRATDPSSPPFVEVGDAVGAGQTLCILEAMKLMNEVQAEFDGVIRAIHVENGHPVEFGQLLFEVEPLAGRPLDGA